MKTGATETFIVLSVRDGFENRKNTFWMGKDQGLRGCNYFFRMAYTFLTITSLESMKIRSSRHFAARRLYKLYTLSII